MEQDIYQEYITILQEELVPAMGCTEPIALAFAGAKCREVLGCMPDRVEVKASGSIIKNVKSVIVPNTNKLRGIPVAIAAGIVGGKSDLQMQVIAEMEDEQISAIGKFVDTVPIKVEALDEGHVFDILAKLYAGDDCVTIRIMDYHTNIIYLDKNGKVLVENLPEATAISVDKEKKVLSMKGIWEFANTVKIEDVEDIIQRQMDCNWAIAMEGMTNHYGANIGKVLMNSYGKNTPNLACAMAAAGSDARMNGCEMPVVVNSGSGNQGMTVCLPVMVYAKTMQVDREKRIRALVLSNLIAIYEKTGIGRLSAYCGAVSAGAAAAAGVAYLHGEDYETVIHTVVNALAASSGIVCDGAKASCAAKIALSVYSGLMGYEMYKRGQQFKAGDGLVAKGVEATLDNIAALASQGMYETNLEIIRMMTQD